MDEELYRQHSWQMSDMHAKVQAGLRQASKLVKYTWTDGSVTWCAYCGFCTGDDRWVIHHSVNPVEDVLAVHVAGNHQTATPIEGITFSTGVGYTRAACQQCGWEQDSRSPSHDAGLYLAAERHINTTHLPPGGYRTPEGCDSGDEC